MTTEPKYETAPKRYFQIIEDITRMSERMPVHQAHREYMAALALRVEQLEAMVVSPIIKVPGGVPKELQEDAVYAKPFPGRPVDTLDLRVALTKAAGWFREYMRSHLEKANAAGSLQERDEHLRKADRNEERATYLENIVEQSRKTLWTDSEQLYNATIPANMRGDVPDLRGAIRIARSRFRDAERYHTDMADMATTMKEVKVHTEKATRYKQVAEYLDEVLAWSYRGSDAIDQPAPAQPAFIQTPGQSPGPVSGVAVPPASAVDVDVASAGGASLGSTPVFKPLNGSVMLRNKHGVDYLARMYVRRISVSNDEYETSAHKEFVASPDWHKLENELTFLWGDTQRAAIRNVLDKFRSL